VSDYQDVLRKIDVKEYTLYVNTGKLSEIIESHPDRQIYTGAYLSPLNKGTSLNPIQVYGLQIPRNDGVHFEQIHIHPGEGGNRLLTVHVPKNCKGAGVLFGEVLDDKPILNRKLNVWEIKPKNLKALYLAFQSGKSYVVNFPAHMIHTFLGGTKGMVAESVHIHDGLSKTSKMHAVQANTYWVPLKTRFNINTLKLSDYLRHIKSAAPIFVLGLLFTSMYSPFSTKKPMSDVGK
jgi:hypothetical protein